MATGAPPTFSYFEIKGMPVHLLDKLGKLAEQAGQSTDNLIIEILEKHVKNSEKGSQS